LVLHLGAHPYSAIAVVVNVGTTVTGAIDDIPGIRKILEEIRPKPLYTIHLDGALSGFVLPIIKPFGDIPDYFSSLGVRTLSFSAHKYPGLSQPCGIILAEQAFFEKAFEKTERSIEYVGNIVDITISGSRSGLNVLMFYNAICTLGLDGDCKKIREMVARDMKTARELTTRLVQIYGPEKVSFLHHFNVSFPRPSMAIAKKYQLMLTGEIATICVLSNISAKLIDELIVDLEHEVRRQSVVGISN
jgi:histidine decarboxylase